MRRRPTVSGGCRRDLPSPFRTCDSRRPRRPRDARARRGRSHRFLGYRHRGATACASFIPATPSRSQGQVEEVASLGAGLSPAAGQRPPPGLSGAGSPATLRSRRRWHLRGHRRPDDDRPSLRHVRLQHRRSAEIDRPRRWRSRPAFWCQTGLRTAMVRSTAPLGPPTPNCGRERQTGAMGRRPGSGQRSEERDVPNQNIIEIVRNRRDDLRKSDRKVADVVLADPKRILNATVAETADAGRGQPADGDPVLHRSWAAAASRTSSCVWRKALRSARRPPTRSCSTPTRPKPSPRRSSTTPSPALTGRVSHLDKAAPSGDRHAGGGTFDRVLRLWRVRDRRPRRAAEISAFRRALRRRAGFAPAD